jgi:hypothetical protein
MAAVQQINAVVVKALHETQLETIDKVKVFLSTNEEVDQDFIHGLLDQFKAQLQADYKPPKGGKTQQPKQKRVPSAYTLFIKDKMNEIKSSNPDVKSGQELMKLAVQEWGAISAEVKEKMKVLNKENPALTGNELFTQCSSASSAPKTTKKK